MATPIKGSSGYIKIDTAGAQKTLTWVGEWEATIQNNTDTVGPHIGDPNEYEVETSQKYTFKVSGTIPEDTDDGQDALFTAVANRTRPQLLLQTIKGKQFLFAANTTVYSKLSIKQTAKGTHTFEAEGSGPATLSDGPTS
jgi:hypothetical protein